MKKFTALVIFTFFMMLSHLSIAPLNANAGENDCILAASVDVIVAVWNLDDNGNKGQLIWKGLIKQGGQKRIESQHGQIRYAQTTVVDENEPLSGDIGRWCNNGKIIGVP
jgi:hypothetical protein